jgi:hypothetical protein
MAPERQIAANRVNGLKGGVKTAEGKKISRLNARKHGIFASALTEYDDAERHGIEDQLVAQLGPVGIIEKMLLEKLAVTYLRMQRCARAEAQHHREMWASPGSIIVRGKRERKIAAIGLYDLRLTNQFLRLLREIKSLQRERTAQRRHPQITQIPQTSSNEVQGWEQQPSENTMRNAEGTVDAQEQEKMKNEPNSGAGAPENNLAKVGTNFRKVEDCTTESARETAKCLVAAKTKNEPNSASEGPTADGLDSRFCENDGHRAGHNLAHSS